MDHPRAISTGAAERYTLGEMPDAEREQYEAHFFECAECADEVTSTARFVDAARPAFAHVRPRARERQALDSTNLPWWPRLRAFFWPVPVGAAAAATALLCVAIYQAAVLIPGLRSDLLRDQGLQPAQWQFLAVSRGEPPVISVPEQERRVGLRLSRSSDRMFPFYRCELLDAQGRVVLSQIIDAPPAGEEVQVLVPVAGLAAGAYTLVVAGLDQPSSAGSASEMSRYQFVLERRAGGTAQQGEPGR